jgi:hypothetical protein
MPQSSFLPPPTSAEILVGAANPYHAACTRRVSAAGLAPTSGEVVMEFQSDSARTDSPVRVLNAQPASPVSARYVWLAKVPAIFSGLSETRRGLYGAIFSISSGGWSFFARESEVAYFQYPWRDDGDSVRSRKRPVRHVDFAACGPSSPPLARQQYHLTCPPRWTASPLRPCLSFRYTQVWPGRA